MTGGGKFGYDILHIPTATSYDFKLWYLDAQGREVIVEWNRARTDADSVREGHSQTVMAREVDASINGTKMKAGAVEIKVDAIYNRTNTTTRSDFLKMAQS